MTQDNHRSDLLDIIHSHVFGALRFALPLLLYALAYPLFIARYGFEAFALWSLIFSVSYGISIANFGFGDFFTREISKATSPDALAASKRRLRLARSLCVVAGLVLIAALLAAEAAFDLVGETVYDAAGLRLSGALLAVGALISVQNRLSEAVLRAHLANASVEFIQAIKQILPIGALLVGIFAGRPFELFGLGFLIAELCQAVALRSYIDRRFPAWQAILPARPRGGRLREAMQLIRESLPLYGLALAMICRDPALRLLLVAQYGLTVTGSYEIAYRIGLTCFNAATVGAASFLPSLSRDAHEGARTRAAAKLAALTVLMGGLSLGIFGSALALSDTIVPAWIEGTSQETLALCKVMILWLWFNALIVPAWYCLIAADREKHVAIAVVVHSLLSPLMFVLSFGSAQFLAAWTGAGVAVYSIAAFAALRGGPAQGVELARGKRWLAILVLLSLLAGVAIAILQAQGVIASLAANLAVLGGFYAFGAFLLFKSLTMLRTIGRDSGLAVARSRLPRIPS